VCKRGFILFILFAVPVLVYSQDVKLRGRFLADSIKIGEAVPYSLTATYPKKLNILYPDSGYVFAPFEFESKKWFATRTTDSLSYDSVVYFLTSYEIDSIQKFRMPIYVLNQSDCTIVMSAMDSLPLKQLVKHVPEEVKTEELPLKTNTNYLGVEWLFNYPIFLIAAGIVIVVLIVVWIIFGKRIRRYFLVKRLNRKHFEFLQKFGDAVTDLQTEVSTKKAENVLTIWKRYMEGLEDKPYTKYSSREILYFMNDEKLRSTLKAIDRMVYGGIGQDTEVFQELKEVSSAHFNDKLREVNNG